MEAETLDIALVFKRGMWSPFKTVYLQMSKASLGKVQSGQVGSVTCDEIPNWCMNNPIQINLVHVLLLQHMFFFKQFYTKIDV